MLKVFIAFTIANFIIISYIGNGVKETATHIVKTRTTQIERLKEI